MLKKLALGLFLLAVPAAHAACVDEVDALAQKYGISSALPRTTGNTESTSDKLAASGGVIAPPPTGDTPSVMPAVPNPDSAMATTPSIAPQTADGSIIGQQATGNTQVASILMAARQAGAKGDDAACEQGLAKAVALLGKSQ